MSIKGNLQAKPEVLFDSYNSECSNSKIGQECDGDSGMVLIMQDEYYALIWNQTWVLSDRSVNDNVINCKWIYKVKHRDDRMIEWFKACLLSNGLRQIKGTNYQETFSLVDKTVSIRLVLSIDVTRGCGLSQLGISNAFLNEVLEERILMSQ